MDSYPTSLGTAITPAHLLNQVPEEDGQHTPSHGGLVTGHEFDLPIVPKSHILRDPSPLRADPMLNGDESKQSSMASDVAQTLTPPVTPTPATLASTARPSSAQPPRQRPVSMPPQSSATSTPIVATNGQRIPSVEPQAQAQPKSRGRVLGNYTMSRTLGAGSMGKVKLAVHNETGEKVGIFLRV